MARGRARRTELVDIVLYDRERLCWGFKELVGMMKRRFLVDGSSEQGGSGFHDWL